MQIEISVNDLSLTQITSRFGGDGRIELGTDKSIAIKTPPPREHRSLRYTIKFVGRISESKTESDSQVSVIHKTL